MKYKYHILCSLILVLMVFHTINVQWTGDFWAHSAAISELTVNPISPKHPLILSNDPDVLFTPYTLALAFFSRVTQWDSVTTLSIAGIINLLLFFYGLKLFTTLLSPKKSSSIAFYALLFTMLLWGRDPLMQSGFLYLSLLGEALPLPATFTFSLTLIALSVHMLIARGSSRLWYAPLSMLSIIIIISNPQTFLLLAIGMVSINIGKRQLPLIDYVLLVCVFIVTLSCALLWPYYPFSYLLPFRTNMYHEVTSSYSAYTAIVWRTFPALIGIPFIIYRMKLNWKDPLLLMLLFLSLVYAYGGLFGKYAYGRLISYIVFTLQISTALGVAQIESKLSEPYKQVNNKFSPYYLILNAVFLIFLGLLVWEAKRFMVPYIQATLLLKIVVFISVVFVSVIVTSLLFRSPGWFYRLSSQKQQFSFFCFILVLTFAISFNGQIIPSLKQAFQSENSNSSGYYFSNKQYEFLSKFTKHYDVVLSDMKTSWVVPTFGGKIIAPLHPPCCVPDYNERVWDIKYFFSDTTVHQKGIMKQFGSESEFGPLPDKPSYAYQLEIIEKYHVDFLLINKLLISSWQKIAESFSPLGHIVFDNEDFVLIAFDSANKKKSLAKLNNKMEI